MSESMEDAGGEDSGAGTVKLIYILYLAGLVVGVTALVGVIMAYINRGDAPDWLRTHYDFLIRTFWIGLLWMVVGTILSMIVIGFLVFLFWIVWLIVRCVKGLKYLDNEEAHPNPEGWMFS